MKKIIAVMLTIATIVTFTATAFAATTWTALDGIEWAWPTMKASAGSGLALVDWDLTPATLVTGRTYKGVASKAHWAVTYGGAPSTHNVGVKSDDFDGSFTVVKPVKATIDAPDTLKAMGYDVDDINALFQVLGADVLRHNNGLSGIAAIPAKQGIRLASWQWSDGSVGAFYKTPDGRIAIGVSWGSGSHKADEPTTPHVGPSIDTDPVKPDGDKPHVGPSIDTDPVSQDGNASSTDSNNDAHLGSIADRYKSH